MLNLFLCFVNIAFTWLNPALTMYEVGHASRYGMAAAQSLGYMAAVLYCSNIHGGFTFELRFGFEVYMHFNKFIF